MQCAVKAVFLCTGLVLLLIPPTASQEQCTLPTDQDVKDVANNLFDALAPEGVTPQTVQELLQVHFTCLARVAQDMYAYATVVTNFTTTSSSDSKVEQFQLHCVDDTWARSPGSLFKNPANIPAMPFTIETQFQCSECEAKAASTPNYNPDSNCLCKCTCICLGEKG